jgi:hypothetical protein
VKKLPMKTDTEKLSGRIAVVTAIELFVDGGAAQI